MKSEGAAKPPGCPNGITKKFIMDKLISNQKYQQQPPPSHPTRRCYNHHNELRHKYHIDNLIHGHNETFADNNDDDDDVVDVAEDEDNVISHENNLKTKCQHFRYNHYHNYYNLTFIAITLMVFFILNAPISVLCDDINNYDNLNGYSSGPEITTTEFNYAARGKKKFGDRCDHTQECGFPGSFCDAKMKSCQCTPDLEATNHIDKCGKAAAVNESCFFNEQCEEMTLQTECRDNRCICRFEMLPVVSKDGTTECKSPKNQPIEPERYIDPAMIMILVGMALMFVIICVVLRLFSKARWRDNRTIFNTPNPRLMNVSLLRDNKLLHGGERRGSRMSVRLPSRQPSMASLRPHSPNASIGSRRGSRGSSNASATSTRSNRSQPPNGNTALSPTSDNQHQQPHHNPAHQPVESVTVEITEVKT